MSTQIKKDLKQKAFIYIKTEFPGSRFIEEISNHRFNAAIIFEYNNKKYFLKTSNVNSFTLEPEYFFLNKTQELGITPKLVEYNKDENILIVEYIDGVFYRLFEKAPLTVFAKMGELLAQIHSIELRSSGKIEDGKLSHRNNVHFTKHLFNDILNDIKFVNHIDDEDALSKFSDLLNSYPIQNNVLTHGDYHVNNLLFAEDQTYVVDSSVYKSNDKHMDLGIAHNFIHARENGEKEWKEFIAEYLNNSTNSNLQMNLAKMHSILFDLRAARRDFNRGMDVQKDVKKLRNDLLISV